MQKGKQELDGPTGRMRSLIWRQLIRLPAPQWEKVTGRRLLRGGTGSLFPII